MSEKYKNLKVKELQELLQKNGLPHTGKKEELIERLVQHDQQNAELASLEEEFGDLEEFDETKLALDDIDDSLEPVEEKKVEQIKTTTTIAPASAASADTKVPEVTTTTTTLKTEVKTTEEPITKPKSNFKFTPIVFDKKKEEKKVDEVVVEKKEEKKPKLPVVPPKVTDDAEKALERAKRFGIQLNETAKKDIRAQRFGIPTTTTTDKKTTNDTKPTKGSPTVKGIDPEVLKKRAERFGLSKPTTATAPGSKVPVIVDSADEEKKRKRAERFQQEAAKKQKAE